MFQPFYNARSTQQITEHGGKEEDCCLSPKACRGRESRRVAVAAEDAEVEGELGLQILRALSILRFLEGFLVVFMVFFFSRRSVLAAAEE
jgi:hypothetical protein